MQEESKESPNIQQSAPITDGVKFGEAPPDVVPLTDSCPNKTERSEDSPAPHQQPTPCKEETINETEQQVYASITNTDKQQVHATIANTDEPIDLAEYIEDSGLRARALYDYEASADDEISFDPNDIITHIEQIDEGWWRGLCRNRYGLFPANYVQLLQ